MKLTNIVGGIVLIAVASYAALVMAHGVDKRTKKMTYFKQASKMELAAMNLQGANAFLSDVVSSNDPEAPITCGLFRIEKGKSLTYTYGYDEAKIIIDGEMTVDDGSTKVTATPGDILFFPKGSTITFNSNSKGTGFICGQRERDGA